MKKKEQEQKESKATKKGKPNKKEYVYIDDGRTIADMNVEGMPGYDPDRDKKKKIDRLTFKEKMAILFGAYRAYFPYLVTLILALAVMYLVFYILWS